MARTAIKSLGLLGCGNMGGAIARGVVAADLLPAKRVFVHDPEPKAMKSLEVLGCQAAGSLTKLFQQADVIVIAVKPQVFKTMSFPPFPRGKVQKTVISVMAGIGVSRLRKIFPKPFTVIRIMPNLGLSVREGATAIATRNVPEASIRLAEAVFNSCGQTVRVAESRMDAVTGLSGSGPMYVFEFIEAMTQAGMDSGLLRKTAYRLAMQTVKGSVKLLETSEDLPSVWSARVRSPGGTTAEAQKVLEKEDFHAIVRRAVAAAVKRSKELSV